MRISEGVQVYLARKRGAGYKYERVERILKQLITRTGDLELTQLGPDHILSCLNRTPVCVATWVGKYWIIRRFFEYCSARGIMPEMRIPPPKVHHRQDFVPHIFTRAEVKKLLEATKRNQNKNYLLDALTLHAILVTLYATGLPVGEVPTIMERDLDVIGGLIRIRSVQANRDRSIPIGRDLCEVLRAYMVSKERFTNGSGNLFLDRHGKPTTASYISRTFAGLRRDSRVYRRDDSTHQPRASDLRFTFAVHRIAEGIENGRDLNRLLPALAAYMGQVGLGSTARYLALTPERFLKDLKKLSPVQRKPHWNEDPSLMAFLTQL